MTITTATTITAEHHIEAPGDGPPSLIITMDLADILEAGRWRIDGVIDVGSGTGSDITILCYPNGDDEGWERLSEVGEW